MIDVIDKVFKLISKVIYSIIIIVIILAVVMRVYLRYQKYRRDAARKEMLDSDNRSDSNDLDEK